MSLLGNKSTRALIIIMTALVVTGITIAGIYYKSVNSSIDPRTVRVREIYKDYNNFIQENELKKIHGLLDTIELIYSGIPHYSHSYELGVAYNNRAALFLTNALYKDSVYSYNNGYENISSDSLFTLAETEVKKSILIYENWLTRFKNLNESQIRDTIQTEFMKGLETYQEKEKQRFLNKRIKEITDAQLENKRRLSVSYTNMGIVFRSRKQYEEAAKYYMRALELWDRNLTAENNLNILLGRPVKKRNLIQKLFPPDRKQ